VVCAFEIHDDEVDVVGAEVVGVAKLDQQCDLTQGGGALPREHALELGIVRLEVCRD
jgi:hypothetical protein